MASHAKRCVYKSCQKSPKGSGIKSGRRDGPKLPKPCNDTSSEHSFCCCKVKHQSSPTPSQTTVWGCNDVKPLANFYDSIPDYCDIYHMPKDEFDSTLDALRASCHRLRTTDISPPGSSLACGLTDDKSTSSLSSLLQQSQEKRAKKSTKKKHRKVKVKHKEPSVIATPCNFENQDYLFDKNRFKSFKEDCEREVEAFRQNLKEFEEELKRPICQTPCKISEETQTEIQIPKFLEVPSKHEQQPCMKKKCKSAISLSECLQKSLSMNDIHECSTEDSSRLLSRLSRINKLDVGESPNKCNLNKNEQPETSPCQFKKSFRTAKKKKRAKSEENCKIPYSPFSQLDYRLGICDMPQGLRATPVHPVARPNHAATLRAQVSKQKLCQPRTNCTFYDGTRHFDWEVRKTPAWKSLLMQETHDQTLMLRLAARKAEQALQQRQYETNLKVMRQRVKSAPLLLEGEHHFGLTVGKLSHTCHDVGSQLTCHSNRSSRSRIRKKTPCSTLTLCPHHKSEMCMSRDIMKRENIGSPLSSKMPAIKNIYGYNLHKHKSRQKATQQQQHINDSGDELTSADRAYL